MTIATARTVRMSLFGAALIAMLKGGRRDRPHVITAGALDGPAADPHGDALNLNLADFDPSVLLLIVPLVLIEFGLLAFAVWDLLKTDRRVRGGSKGMWAVIIVFVNVIGPVLYLLVGRVDGPPEDEAPGPGAMPGWGSPHDPPIVGSSPSTPGAAAPVPAAVVTPVAAPVLAPVMAPGAASASSAPAVASAPRTPGGPSAIRIEALTRRYPGVLALDALNLDVPEGSIFGLLGPNGAGKTTTLRLLAGLGRPTSGRAVVAGIPVSADDPAVRRQLGFLEQDPRAYGWMTGREQLRLLGRLHGLRGAALEGAVADVLARLDLADAADRRAGTYSGGMRQRLGIAGALVHRPPGDRPR